MTEKQKKAQKGSAKKRMPKEKPVTVTIDPNALYSPLEAAQAIHLSPRTFEKVVKAGKIVPTWVGKGKRVFRGAGLLDYLQRQTSPTAPAA